VTAAGGVVHLVRGGLVHRVAGTAPGRQGGLSGDPGPPEEADSKFFRLESWTQSNAATKPCAYRCKVAIGLLPSEVHESHDIMQGVVR